MNYFVDPDTLLEYVGNSMVVVHNAYSNLLVEGVDNVQVEEHAGTVQNYESGNCRDEMEGHLVSGRCQNDEVLCHYAGTDTDIGWAFRSFL